VKVLDHHWSTGIVDVDFRPEWPGRCLIENRDGVWRALLCQFEGEDAFIPPGDPPVPAELLTRRVLDAVAILSDP
jgi:hypothetical protein